MKTWAKVGLAVAAVGMLATLLVTVLVTDSQPVAAAGKVTCDSNGKPRREGARMCRDKKLWICKKDALGIGVWSKTEVACVKKVPKQPNAN
jgi:hypothetical protein